MLRDIRAYFANPTEMADAARLYLQSLADDDAMRTATRNAMSDGLGAIYQKGRLIVEARKIDRLPGTLRVYLGCATYLTGEPGDDCIVRLDTQRRRVTYIALGDRRTAFPISSNAVNVVLRRQTMSIAETGRCLIAKRPVLGVATKAQAKRQDAYRLENGLQPDVVIERI